MCLSRGDCVVKNLLISIPTKLLFSTACLLACFEYSQNTVHSTHGDGCTSCITTKALKSSSSETSPTTQRTRKCTYSLLVKLNTVLLCLPQTLLFKYLYLSLFSIFVMCPCSLLFGWSLFFPIFLSKIFRYFSC